MILKTCFLILFTAELFSAECIVKINELNVIDPEKIEKKEFIELKTDCKDMPLRGHKVIGIKAGKKKGSPSSIVLVATLWNQKFSGDLYTIGGISVEKSDMKISSDFIKFRESWNNKNNLISITNFLENGKTDIYAIGILYNKNDPMSTIQLEKNKNSIIIDDKLNEFLKNNLIDLVVYSEKSDRDRCDIFEELHPPFAQKKYTLREFSFKRGSDISLNRCTIESDGFVPEKFKIGKPTPGLENDCSGAYFIFEDRIQEILPNFISSVDIDVNDEHDIDSLDNTCTSSIRPAHYDLATDEQIEKVLTAANAESSTNQCTMQQLYPDGGNLAEEVDHGNRRKRRLSSEKDYSEKLEWETEDYFE